EGAAADGRFRSVLDEWRNAPPERRADALAALAEGYFNAGRREEALKLNDAACAAADRAGPWMQKGRFHLQLGETAAAREAFARAVALDPGRQDARFFLTHLGADPAGILTP